MFTHRKSCVRVARTRLGVLLARLDEVWCRKEPDLEKRRAEYIEKMLSLTRGSQAEEAHGEKEQEQLK